MALCGVVGAMALPSELIVHIFSFLSDRDKLRASAVCSRWRECLFYPALWTELKLRIGGGCNGGGSSSEDTPKLEFLMRKFGSFVRELQLELAPVGSYLSPLNNDSSNTRMDQVPGPESDPQLSERWRDAMATYLDQVLCVFTSIRHNRNLKKLSLYGDTCILQQEGLLDSSNLHQIHQGDKKINEIQQLFMEFLSNSRQLRYLSCSFMLGLVTPCSLACLSNPSAETLQHLSLLDHQLGPLISPSELDRLSNLHSLALDFSDLTSELCGLLASPHRTPLHRLSLLLNGAALEFKPLEGTATEDDWKTLVRRSANLRVYIMALEVGSTELLRVLKPSLPLERLQLDSYSTLVTDSIVELISQQYNKTLTHFLLLRDDQDLPDLSVNRNEDPLVLLAWRCTQLAVLVIHGYTVWSHNLVAISRLRGSSLKVLTVSEESIDFDPDQSICMEGDPVHNLVMEVSLSLGRVWHPCLDSSLVLPEPTQHFHRELHVFSMGISFDSGQPAQRQQR
ncbi:F-box only protein 33-like isoform X2 [Betta splendens]|uniref:F-box only protein 33-like isoform X2 n=1 Tax=Betta splendens TaxID=158456 RepID=A0A6P7LKF9_BETSP|nr:LOW QUALITY PROTEIN: F-box only protein 33-like [Betta splendens]XP_028994348.1 F-box only protein 33-like isoform X2 [Betta splendens]